MILSAFHDSCSQFYILPTWHLLICGRSAVIGDRDLMDVAIDGCVFRLLARGETTEPTPAEHRPAKGDY